MQHRGHTIATRLSSGPGWINEIKHDGFRILARRDGADVRLTFPEISGSESGWSSEEPRQNLKIFSTSQTHLPFRTIYAYLFYLDFLRSFYQTPRSCVCSVRNI
jgi:hypothetical protein